MWGNTTTTTYDQVGRPVDSDGPQSGTGDLTHVDYDAVGQVSAQKLGGLTIATPTYNTPGELTAVSYPTGTGNGGNGTSGTIVRDAFGQTVDRNWRLPNLSLLTYDHVVRSQSGRVVDETIDGSDAYTAGNNFQYDTAGRLTAAEVANKLLGYTYAASGGCGSWAAAGKNSNRTAVEEWTTDNAGQNPVLIDTWDSCYDNVDRLTAAEDAVPIIYDGRGNTRRLGTQALGYDGADRNTALASGSDAVKYTRDATDRIVARATTTIGQRATPTAVPVTTVPASDTSISPNRPEWSAATF